MTCPHQSQPPGKDTGRRLCAIGRYGGRPYLGNCMECQAQGLDRELLGDKIEALVKPIAKAFKLPCLDKNGGLKPMSGCAKRRDKINQLAARVL